MQIKEKFENWRLLPSNILIEFWNSKILTIVTIREYSDRNILKLNEVKYKLSKTNSLLKFNKTKSKIVEMNNFIDAESKYLSS